MQRNMDSMSNEIVDKAKPHSWNMAWWKITRNLLQTELIKCKLKRNKEMKSAGKSTACAVEDGGDSVYFNMPTAKWSRFSKSH